MTDDYIPDDDNPKYREFLGAVNSIDRVISMAVQIAKEGVVLSNSEEESAMYERLQKSLEETYTKLWEIKPDVNELIKRNKLSGRIYVEH